MSEQYPKAVVCRVLNVARSSLYHQPNSMQNEVLETAMQEICAEFPCYGYRVNNEMECPKIIGLKSPLFNGSPVQWDSLRLVIEARQTF
jgi:hypothetical protein